MTPHQTAQLVRSLIDLIFAAQRAGLDDRRIVSALTKAFDMIRRDLMYIQVKRR